MVWAPRKAGSRASVYGRSGAKQTHSAGPVHELKNKKRQPNNGLALSSIVTPVKFNANVDGILLLNVIHPFLRNQAAASSSSLTTADPKHTLYHQTSSEQK